MWLPSRVRPSRLSLSARFGAASALILLVGAGILGTWITQEIENSVLHRAAANSAMYVEALVGPAIRGADGDPAALRASLAAPFAELLRTRRAVAIKVWAPDGRILYATEAGLIGQTFTSVGLRGALGGDVVAERSRLDEDENVRERDMATELLETYVPIRAEPTSRIIAVVEFYQPTDLLDADMTRARTSTWALIAAATITMYVLLFNIVRWGSDTIERQRRDLTAAFGQLSVTMQRLRVASAERAETDEAALRRVAREIHDGLAQDLAAALITIDRDPRNGTARAAIESALGEVRALATGLAAPDVAPLSLCEVVEQACNEHERKTGQVVQREISPIPHDVPGPVKIAVYRVLQESLSNAFRHAGPGTVGVRASAPDGILRVECIDEGPGLNERRRTGLGLRSMRERVELLDGTLVIASRESRGTAVTAEIPLSRTPEIA